MMESVTKDSNSLLEVYVAELYDEKCKLEQLVVTLSLENAKLKGLEDNSDNKLFGDFMLEWLSIHKARIQETTYLAYETQVMKHIVPFFNKRGTFLRNITTGILQEYYTQKIAEGLSGNTVAKHHSNIYSSLQYAVKTGLIQSNPAHNVDKPQIVRYNGSFLPPDKLNVLYDLFLGTPLYPLVLIAGIMGLRRSEILGLKWENIDFCNSTLTVCHSCVKIEKDAHAQLLFKDTVKSASSFRTLPIPQKLLAFLKKMKAEQVLNYVHNRNYCKTYSKYVCINSNGDFLKPDYVTNTFKKILISNHMTPIRFHDLRHSCASTLFSMGYTMKDIQEWLGHSDIAITSNIYTHIDFTRKITMASGVNNIICVQDSPVPFQNNKKRG